MISHTPARHVVVTGGAGFIGSELVRQLAGQGQTVVVVDNLINGRRENLLGTGGNVQFIQGDIRDSALMRSVLKATDIVFHLACLGVRHSIHSPIENHDVNASGTLRLISESSSAGVKRFVYVSSSEIYGTARSTPMTEEHPVYPMTVYGASKFAGEAYTRAFWETYRYPTVVVRPFNSYGPCCHHEGDSGEVIPKFILRCLVGKTMVVFGEGTQTRDFTFVSDTARGIMEAGFSDAAVGETINLGSGTELQINDLARTVAEVLGRPSAEVVHDAPRPGDVLRLCADTRKAQRLLEFAPRVPLREGIQRLANWYRDLARSPEELLQQEVVRNWDLRAKAVYA
jgi:UDP-glucose 4-epimerase